MVAIEGVNTDLVWVEMPAVAAKKGNDYILRKH